MTPIADFELLSTNLRSQANGGQDRVLFKCGQSLTHLDIKGEVIFGQFRAPGGYVIFSGANADEVMIWLPTEYMAVLALTLPFDVSFIPDDLSVVQAATMSVNWWRPEYRDKSLDSRFVVPPLVDDFRVVDERRLDFHVTSRRRFGAVPPRALLGFRAKGWYRLTMTETAQRFASHTIDVDNASPAFWHPRHFTIARAPSP